MDFSLVHRILPFIGYAAITTIELSAAATAIGIIVATLVVVARFSRRAPLRWLAAVFVSIMRGTPLLVQLFLVFFGGPQLGLDFSPFAAAVTTMGVNIGAYMSEGIRGAILSVDRGQTEAARTLGFGRFDTMRLFILPQAAPLMMRSIGVNTVILTKSTALVSTIGVVELTYSAQRFVTSTFKPFEVFTATGAAYLVIIAAITLVMSLIERSLQFGKGA